MNGRRILDILMSIIIVFFIFIFSYGSIGQTISVLRDYELIGPDPYLFYQYTKDLIYNHTLQNTYFNAFYPIGSHLYSKNLISYFGFLTYSILATDTGFQIFLLLNKLSDINSIGSSILIWLSLHATPALLFAISSIIYYFLLNRIFKDKYFSFFVSIMFALIPIVILRDFSFETEVAGTLGIISSLLIYLIILETKQETKLKEKLKYMIYPIFILFIGLFLIQNYNTDVIRVEILSGILLILLISYPLLRKNKKAYYYSLLVLTSVFASKGWGGWIIIPLIITLVELFRFIRGEYDIEYLVYLFVVPYTSILGTESTPMISNMLVAPILLHAIYYITNKLNFIKNILDKIYQRKHVILYLFLIISLVLSILSSIFLYLGSYGAEFLLPIVIFIVSIVYSKYKIPTISDNSLKNRLTFLLLILVLSLPFLIYFMWKNLILSPLLTDRMLQSVAEYQPTNPRFMTSSLGYIGIISIFLFTIMILTKKESNPIDYLYAIFVSVLLIISLFFSEIHPIFTLLILFLLALPQIIFINNIDDNKKLFIISIFLITVFISDYIYRLVYYIGLSLPILFGFSINESIERIKDKLNNKTLLITIINISLILLSIFSLISLILYVFKDYNLFFISLSIFIIYAIAVYYYFLDKNMNFVSYMTKYSIVLFLIFLVNIPGVISLPSYIINFYLSAEASRGSLYPQLFYGMLYLREFTPENSIVNAWWDYGYYIQAIAERTSWLDGSNPYPYWNHLMGRYGFSSSFEDALRLFYVHSVYNYEVFRVLELFGKNNIFYDYYYKLFNFSNNDIKTLENLKNRLKNKWIDLLFQFNGSIDSIREYNLSENEINVLEKIYRINYLRPSYLYIDPTDIGKSFQFMRLGSNSRYDKMSLVTYFISATPYNPNVYNGGVIINNYVVFASDNFLIYREYFPLDEQLNINGTIIPSCIDPNTGLFTDTNCGIIYAVQLSFKDKIVYVSGLNEYINMSAININNIEDARVLLYYNNQVYNLSLGCVYMDGEIWKRNAEYNGCLYIVPSYGGRIEFISKYGFAYFLSQKIMNYSWVRLYFFNEMNPYFQLVYAYPDVNIYNNVQPSKIWKVNYPENFTVPSYLYCLYLATDLNEINKCAKIYNLSNYKSIWDV